LLAIAVGEHSLDLIAHLTEAGKIACQALHHITCLLLLPTCMRYCCILDAV